MLLPQSTYCSEGVANFECDDDDGGDDDDDYDDDHDDCKCGGTSGLGRTCFNHEQWDKMMKNFELTIKNK